jgi:hypothetical protein
MARPKGSRDKQARRRKGSEAQGVDNGAVRGDTEAVFGEDGEPEVFADEPGNSNPGEERPAEHLEPAGEERPAERPTPTGFDPSAGPENDTASDYQPRERRGRPRGSSETREGKRKKRGGGNEADNPQNLTLVLLSVHSMMAAMLDAPEFLLTQEKAEPLANAIHEVNKLYPKSFLSPEATAWGNLGLVAIATYYPMYVAFSKRRKAEEPIDVDPLNAATPINVNMSRGETGTIG